ncbi:MAG: hypothetical protein IKG27_03960 [Bacilli bacterium]|nr:hypothetical protein [Bacilli bacterium]
MRRFRRGRQGISNKILIFGVLGLFSVLTIGYAAFQTNISLTAKGNVTPATTYTVNQLKSLAVTSGDGLYADTAETGRYVYKGASPDNYLSLNNETWRIVSIESDNTLKIIREDSLGNNLFDPGRNSTISGITASGSDVGTRYSSTDFCNDYSSGCKVWGSKDTMRDSSGTLLKNTAGGAKMARAINGTTYNLPNDEAYLNIYLNGGTYANVAVTGWYDTWSSNLNSNVESYIEDEHTYNVGLVSNTSGQLTATDISQEKALTWKGRVGLLTVSEYVRASTNSACTGAYAYRNTTNCYNNGASHNYLRKASSQWTISPRSNSNAYYLFGCSSTNLSINSTASNTSAYGVRPVLHLSSNTVLKGAGTSAKKFQIVATSPNNSGGGGSGGSGGGGGSSNTVYAINTNTITKNSSTLQDIGTTYGSCAATGKSVCIRYTVEGNIVTGAEACFIKGGTEYCLTGWHDESLSGITPIYDLNVGTLNTAFTETNACTDYGNFYTCRASGLNAYTYGDGYVGGSVSSWSCYVLENDSAGCE